MQTKKGSNGGVSGPQSESGPGSLVRRLGWENAMAIASRVTIWDFP